MRGAALRIAMLLLAAICAAPVARAASPAAQSFPLPGDGPWDYVTYDARNGRVFIGRFDGVQVVRADTGRLAATIGARSGDHGALVVPDANRVFTSDARARRLGVYALGSLAAQGGVPLHGEPDGMAYDPATKRVLAFLPLGNEIVAVDAHSLHVVGRLAIGGEAEGGVPDGHGAMFITLRDRGDVVRVDVAAMRVTARWQTGCERPSPIALDAASGRLFIGCRDDRILMLDAANGRVVGSAPTGEGTDSLAFDAGRHLAIAANGGGSITLVHVDGPDRYSVRAQIAMPKGARTMALDAAGGRLFTVTADIASEQPPTRTRPYPRLIPKSGTFRMIVVRLPPP